MLLVPNQSAAFRRARRLSLLLAAIGWLPVACLPADSLCQRTDPGCSPGALFLLYSSGALAGGPPGTLDASFGGGQGYYIAPFAAGAGPDSGVGLALDASERILVIGGVTGVLDDVGVWRVRADGSGLDPDFNGTGVRVYSTANNEYPGDIAVTSSGRILAVVSSYSIDFNATTFGIQENGALDPAFGAGGESTWDGGQNDLTSRILLNADGTYFISGQMDNGGQFMDYSIFKYQANGGFDTTFAGGSGRFQINNLAGTTDDRGNFIARSISGALYMGGYAGNPGPNEDIAIIKVQACGCGLDASFNGAGSLVINSVLGSVALNERSEFLAVDSQDRLVALITYNSGTAYGLMRILPGGALDASFANAGVAVLGGPGAGLLIDSAGRILVSGVVGGDLTIQRFLPDGSLDAAFGTGGAFTLANAGTDAAGRMVFDSRGRIVVAASLAVSGVRRMGVARVWN